MANGRTDDHPTTTEPPAHRRDGKAMVLSFGSLLIFDIGLTLLLYNVARSRGASETVAYLIASVGPLIGMASGWIRTRKLGGASVIILILTLLSALVALVGGNDPRLLLVKDSLVTGGFGLATLISMLPVFPKPLMFFFGIKFGTDGSQEGVQQWYDMYDRYPAFRRSQYVINTVWGVTFLVEAVIKIVLAYTLSFDAAFTFNQIAPFVLLSLVITWTIWYGQRQRRLGEARRRAAEAAAAA